jgi:outer membrane protein assembly factor BamB
MVKTGLCFGLLLALVQLATSQPVLEIYPDSFKFGYISVGGYNQRSFVLSNGGNQSLIIDSVVVNSAFYMPGMIGMTINPNDSQIVDVRFTPPGEGDFSGVCHFYSNDPVSPVKDIIIVAIGVRAFAPGEAIWTYQHIEDVVCVAATQDYDGDGLPDVVAEGYDAGAVGDNLVCFSGSGDGNIPNIIWSASPQGGPSNSGGWGDGCLNTATDIDGDGYNDILLGTAWGSRTVFAISGKTGQTIWSYDTYQHLPSGWIYSVCQTSDNNNDGIPEVFAAAGSDANAAFCLDGSNGELIWQKTVEDAVMSIASLSDVNGDAKDEAAFGVADNGTTAYCISGASSGNGTLLWTFNLTTSTFWTTTIQDINHDGYREVLCGTWGNGNYLYAFNGHRAGQGQMLWRTSIGGLIMRVVACPDLNGDGHEDVLVASSSYYALVLSGADGSELWRGYASNYVWAIDYTADLTGDSIPEVVYGSFDGGVYCANGATGAQVWQFTCPYKIFSLRGTGDVNGDGYADVIAGTQYLRTDGGKVYVISGGQAGTNIIDDSPTLPDAYLNVSCYPNPFNSSTAINFTLAKSGNYALSIFDIAGRLVKRFNGFAAAGKNNIVWNAAGEHGIATGVYLYHLAAGNQIGKGKVTLLK